MEVFCFVDFWKKMSNIIYMQDLHFSIFINAPIKKVWDTMLEDATYRIWTKPFNEGGSYYEGDWSEGSKIIFLGPDKDGKVEGGMLSRIKANRQHEYISIEHIGMINKGVEELFPENKYANENYSFVEKDGGTQLDIEMTQIPFEYADDMNTMWPKALEVLKELVEKN